MSRDLQKVLKLAIENSEGDKVTPLRTEDAVWLKEALSAATVDLTKRIIQDVQDLSALMDSPEHNHEQMELVLEDLIVLTEDIDLSNDFSKVGGTDVLLKLLFSGPSSVKGYALQLLANLTQNNPEAQNVYIKKDVLPRLLIMLEENNNVEESSKLLLAISCLTRGYQPGTSIFVESGGFNCVMNCLMKLQDAVKGSSASRSFQKGAFLIYCLLQEISSEQLSSSIRSDIICKIVDLIPRTACDQEHLLATAAMLLSSTNSDSNSDLKSLTTAESFNTFVSWLRNRDDELKKLNDPGYEEIQSHISSLLQTLNIHF